MHRINRHLYFLSPVTYFIVLLSMAHQTCGMDCQDWMPIKKWEDVTRFAGLYVAYKTDDQSVATRGYRIDPNQEIYYGLISFDYSMWIVPGYATGPCHALFKTLCTYDSHPVRRFDLTTNRLVGRTLSMRLLTFNEARHLNRKIGHGPESVCVQKHEEYPVPDAAPFKLRNLLGAERINYFLCKARENIWQKQRLLHIASKEVGSILYGLPRDIIRLITRHVIDVEAEIELRKSNPEMQLLLEHKK